MSAEKISELTILYHFTLLEAALMWSSLAPAVSSGITASSKEGDWFWPGAKHKKISVEEQSVFK